ncbi:5-methyltetrahydropteroyltriglutamate--homocysteine S-methyltransferase [Corynebacterium mendelii]|uniref:5-methyltetrahydropteroyltriglutamate--homocysteine S-methyltransferase n=1 Tax=Corynebacterium mendelii TaxID=2765362 RepID=A0A939DYR8_9CORY|nr:5-methyltetrahydropteroyltriglutamate--homocysteine S-methyltransferase [Corynebacterium mendelii]MBN9643483.1 5-methyltetrahydropteroyltriglutamate--homocysteine S-methyltransferase [Corynebacterium mendelii]
MPTLFDSTVAGVGRIGPNRELKKALEKFWADPSTGRELSATAQRLTRELSENLGKNGLSSIAHAGRSYYDAVHDVTALLGLFPQRVRVFADHTIDDGLPGHIDRYFAAARGAQGIPALAMTKWFDTNYHYLVPELSSVSQPELDAEWFVADIADAVAVEPRIRPVLVGPITYLALARTTDGSCPFELLDAVVDCYAELITRLAATGVGWIQLDEPILATDIDADPERAGAIGGKAEKTYRRLAAALHDSHPDTGLVVQTYFGDGNAAVELLQDTGIDALGVDLVTYRTDERCSAGEKTSPEQLLPAWKGGIGIVAGVVDGRNIWRTDLSDALEVIEALKSRGEVAVSTSASLLHVPYTLAGDSSFDTDPELKSWLAFGAEKAGEVAVLARLAAGESSAELEAAVQESTAARASRTNSGRTHSATVRSRVAAVTDSDRTRQPWQVRRSAQKTSVPLPPLATTTIGSFPQTSQIRQARAAHRNGKIDDRAYREAMEKEIADCIARQEELGLDVLVHGEAERNDMVQYFSEQLHGYHATANGWVQSYGSRCVRPPILYGDIVRPEAMTVDWFAFAQSLTDKPVKGMLTGPVTMLAWSFVRDDQPLGDTADQVALVLRDEIADLVAAGAKIIQVDEPAIRELLPLVKDRKGDYLAWSVGSFRLATGGAAPETQIHTHMCYSEFNELIDAIDDLDADVTSIEAARNGMQVLAAVKDHGYSRGIGPGVWDIHSPRVPDRGEVDELVDAALESVPAEALWINPDCGLKTRGWEETTASLEVLVAAAQAARDRLQ